VGWEAGRLPCSAGNAAAGSSVDAIAGEISGGERR
jgi:hypothetical protein